MTSTIERVLYEQLGDTFIAVHKSQEMNKEMGTWDKKIMRVSEDEIEGVCKIIARNITKFIEDGKKRGKEPTKQQIKNKMAEELNNL